MTMAEFVQSVQAYYDVKYPAGQRADILAYLRGKSDDYLDALYATCKLRYSAKWKTAPDIAIFEELKEEARGHLRVTRKALPEPETMPELSQDEIDAIFAEIKKAVGREHS